MLAFLLSFVQPPAAEVFSDKTGTQTISTARQDVIQSLPPLPTVWHIIWSDVVSPQKAAELKAMGFDGLFKCVAHRPNYPNPPIYAAGEWRLVEAAEGQYDWNDLRRCLDAGLQANMWVIPEIVINIPPPWFVNRYPDSLLRDSRGETVPSNVAAPYLLSPWFVASGSADADLIPFINSFLALVSDYPNVAGIMVGNFLLNNLPWRLGGGSDFTYWPIFDAYALADYQSQFGTQPPATWADYLAMSPSVQSVFRGWLVAAISGNLQNRYLPWISSYGDWKIINAPMWDDNGVQSSVFTTMTPEMVALKQAAVQSAGLPGIVINDDNMGDCGLSSLHQQDINLAYGNGFLIVGERVPDTCSWSDLFSMWQVFSPRPDGFINIQEPDPYWIGQFRTLYGPATEPLPFSVHMPAVIQD